MVFNRGGRIPESSDADVAADIWSAYARIDHDTAAQYTLNEAGVNVRDRGLASRNIPDRGVDLG